jgi:hypothetical protein
MGKTNGLSDQTVQELRLNRGRKFFAWLIFQAFIPYAVAVLCWPAAQLLFSAHYAFERNFVGADLLLAGTLLLAGIAVEIWCEQRANRQLETKGWLDFHFVLSLALAGLLLLVFGFLKSKSLEMEFPQSGTAATLDPNVHRCVWASIAGGMLALIWSIAATACSYRCFLAGEVEAAKKKMS